MSSAKQIDANRRNARRSTGPNTPEGKAASRQNAVTHALFAHETVLPEEDRAQLQALVSAYFAEFRPASACEEFLVRQMASAQWRLHRLNRVESGVFDALIEAVKDDLPFRSLPPEEPLPESRRYDRDSAIMGRAFARDCRRPASLATLGRYEAGVRRSYYRALEELRRLRAARAGKKNAETNPIP
jgi:hypothetical protein